MKKAAGLLGMIFIISALYAHPKHKIEEWSPTTDSVYTYKWDNALEIWTNPNIQTNTVDPVTGLLEEILVRNVTSGENVNKQIFEYDEDGLRIGQQFINWKDGIWENYRRNLTNYTKDDQISDILIQYWREEAWVDEIWQKNYTYNEFDKLTYYEFHSMKNEVWTLGRFDFWNYDENNLLVHRISTFPDGGNYYQIFYAYNDFYEWEIMTAQRWTDNGWENYWKRQYEYDNCGNLLVQEEQKWVNNDWRNNTRTEYYYSFPVQKNKYRRIPVCHNGHTIYLPTRAVPSHLKHGDCLGRCAIGDKHPKSSSNKSHHKSSKYKSSERDEFKSGLNNDQVDLISDFKIYPNPFSEALTIEFGVLKSSLRKVELIDFSGKIVWQHNQKDEPQISIPRDNLPDGIYLLRLISDEIRIEKVILQSQ